MDYRNEFNQVLDDFLAAKGPRHEGLKDIYCRYQSWLERQDWYNPQRDGIVLSGIRDPRGGFGVKTVFDLLSEIRDRPSMYLGFDAEHRREQLEHLQSMLFGYSRALRMHGIHEPGESFPGDFLNYLRETRPDWSLSCGPAAAVMDRASSQEEAWELYWQLIEEFRRSKLSDRP